MGSRYLLDTNTISMAARGDSLRVDWRLAAFKPGDLCISVITEAEVLYGIAKMPEATRIAELMRAMLARFTILPWVSETAAEYGRLRAEMRRIGRSLGPLDMLVAAHARAIGVTLVTNDYAFRHVPGLTVENWTQA